MEAVKETSGFLWGIVPDVELPGYKLSMSETSFVTATDASGNVFYVRLDRGTYCLFPVPKRPLNFVLDEHAQTHK